MGLSLGDQYRDLRHDALRKSETRSVKPETKQRLKVLEKSTEIGFGEWASLANDNEQLTNFKGHTSRERRRFF